MTQRRKKYVIIGAGAAGMAAAATIGKHDRTAEITIVSEETDRPYFRPMIPFLISGRKNPSEMALEGRGPFILPDLEMKLSARATAVDTEIKTVALNNGEKLRYDKLLIATGSSPLIPEVLIGKTVAGVHTLRTLAQARAIAKQANRAKQVVMLGGGMLNVKTAFALSALGLDVTLVEIKDSVLPWLMEADAAALIHGALQKAGLKVITGATLSGLDYDPHRGLKGVVLDNGRELACQMLIVGIGIRPNISFLKKTPLKLDQGVLIDEHCACSAANVFAAGDVAASIDPADGTPVSTGLWTHAVEMGQCAGKNMTGIKSEYSGPYGILNATQVADVPFVSTGIVHTKNTDYESHVYTTKKSYRKFVFTSQGDRLIGALFVGEIAEAGIYRSLIQQKRSVNNIKRHIIRHRLHYGHILSNAA